MVSRLRDGCAGEICDVFAQRQPAVDEQAGQRSVGAELFGQSSGPRVKVLAVFGRPPICQCAGRIIFAALIVESVADLVTDDETNPAIVHSIISIRIEEWRLQNGRRKNDLVQARAVIGVDRLG